MTNQQYDYLLSMVIKQNKLIESLTERVSSMETSIEQLSKKTVVVSNIDEQLNKIKLDIKSLIDEKEA